MKYLLIFIMLFKISFSLPVEGISWRMTKEEVESSFPAMKKLSFDEDEEVYRAEERVHRDIAFYDFLFYRGRLIQVTISNKYLRQNESLSRHLLDIIDEEYTFTSIRTDFIKEDGRIKEVQEYYGISEDGESHLIIKVDLIKGKHINTFIFTDYSFIVENGG
ncbi:hypothetical protein PM10SUCC1_37150 [Propionigenium maris DSM 9537]|uniref:Uncharacterized protein n=1 Tax=Propionigenium maris DSM 9537 TaxID=1123000 RepID=A0A9W6LPB2_9FUSO|nr:hypothetical protein [Propionigenium maris]GLI58201.1 hypothetical protein PM10SUCC1_37150 [Propionigenium maris DSM 9537]